MKLFAMRRSLPSTTSRKAPHAASDPNRSLEVARAKPSPSRRFLRKSDLQEKLLITRTTGRQFGSIGEAWVEPRRLYVQSFDVVVKSQIIRSEVRGSVSLQNIREVGDVVLIDSERDFNSEGPYDQFKLMNVSGLKLVSENGTVIGRCVDFVFEPQTGRIVKLVFHTVNLPFANKNWFDQYAVSVQHISRIVLSERIIYLKPSSSWNKVMVGEYQFLANLIPSFDLNSEDEESRETERSEGGFSDLQSQYEKLLEESRRQQEAYSKRYGSAAALPEPQRRTVQRRPPSPSKVRMDEYLVKDERREEMYLQEEV